LQPSEIDKLSIDEVMGFLALLGVEKEGKGQKKQLERVLK